MTLAASLECWVVTRTNNSPSYMPLITDEEHKNFVERELTENAELLGENLPQC
jgi:hypothetical protein